MLKINLWWNTAVDTLSQKWYSSSLLFSSPWLSNAMAHTISDTVMYCNVRNASAALTARRTATTSPSSNSLCLCLYHSSSLSISQSLSLSLSLSNVTRSFFTLHWRSVLGTGIPCKWAQPPPPYCSLSLPLIRPTCPAMTGLPGKGWPLGIAWMYYHCHYSCSCGGCVR